MVAIRLRYISILMTTIITPHIQDLGGFDARRLLPNDTQSMVGPFIFFDHMGPAVFPPGKGIDVRPHPHINLATVTYLFEGAILHRDSLGTIQEIRPGAVNWMTAGRGISHSERSPHSERATESRLHGIQTWVALPEDVEETDPSFQHYPANEIPNWDANGVVTTLILGQNSGHISPVKTFSPILYLDLQFAPEGCFGLSADYSERAIYSVTDGLTLDGNLVEPHRLVILEPNKTVAIHATHRQANASSSYGRCMVIGGDPVGVRHKWWNFVSSRLDRIEQAKQDWRDGKFGQVTDETEWIPLPEA